MEESSTAGQIYNGIAIGGEEGAGEGRAPAKSATGVGGKDRGSGSGGWGDCPQGDYSDFRDLSCQRGRVKCGPGEAGGPMATRNGLRTLWGGRGEGSHVIQTAYGSAPHWGCGALGEGGGGCRDAEGTGGMAGMGCINRPCRHRGDRAGGPFWDRGKWGDGRIREGGGITGGLPKDDVPTRR